MLMRQVFDARQQTTSTKPMPDMTTSEGLFAEVLQLIAARTLASFLMPDMVSKNDARHGISGYPNTE